MGMTMGIRSIRRPLVFALALAFGSLSACHGSTEAPEAGAVLLRGDAGPRGPDARRSFSPSSTTTPARSGTACGFRPPGPLVPQSATALGTILISRAPPSATLRIDLRGLLGGVPVDEATLKIPSGCLLRWDLRRDAGGGVAGRQRRRRRPRSDRRLPVDPRSESIRLRDRRRHRRDRRAQRRGGRRPPRSGVTPGAMPAATPATTHLGATKERGRAAAARESAPAASAPTASVARRPAPTHATAA